MTKVREISAHRPHPGRGGSLCGEVTRVVPCKACDRKHASLIQVHIRSPRKPGKAFCGQVLRSDDSDPVESSISDLPPLYVSAERARDMAGDAGTCLPMCPGCWSNLERFDEATARKSRTDVDGDGDDDVAAVVSSEVLAKLARPRVRGPTKSRRMVGVDASIDDGEDGYD